MANRGDEADGRALPTSGEFCVYEMQGLEQLSHLRKQSSSQARRQQSVREAAAKAAWSRPRQRVASFLCSSRFEALVGVLIFCNFVLIVIETDLSAKCVDRGDSTKECVPPWLSGSNYAMLACYTLELVMRAYVDRERLFLTMWNIFDTVIVVSGYVDLAIEALQVQKLPGLQMLRVFRLTRLLRAARFLRIFPELNSLLRGFTSAMATMVWGFVSLVLLLLIWGIVAVELIQPASVAADLESERCRKAFSSVFEAIIILFQTLVAGDAWGECALPIINGAPGMLAVFMAMLVCVNLGFTNLVLSVIVERAAEAQRLDVQQQMLEQQRRKRDAERRLDEVCLQMDTNEDGVLSLDELIRAYTDNKEFRECLEVLDVDSQHLKDLFTLMDTDGSGDVSYDELVRYIHRADSFDMRRQMMFLKLQMQDVSRRIKDNLEMSVLPMVEMLRVLVGEKGYYASPRRCNCQTALPRDARPNEPPLPPPMLDEELAACRRDLERRLAELEQQLQATRSHQSPISSDLQKSAVGAGRSEDADAFPSHTWPASNGRYNKDMNGDLWEAAQTQWGVREGGLEEEEPPAPEQNPTSSPSAGLEQQRQHPASEVLNNLNWSDAGSKMSSKSSGCRSPLRLGVEQFVINGHEQSRI
eukprot:TRINITY_DN13835_c0_g1_i1.p1 TRINITY_DN13835_c0_g1~~TRINITY_DN13835_c0_g1_i1.p1  ORF type:complete len:651 (+),score=152.54 TRINITY_DN13835_c0_g1_i1:26-1954(+)